MKFLGFTMILCGIFSWIEEHYINPERYQKTGFARLAPVRRLAEVAAILGGLMLVAFFPWTRD